MDDLYRKRRLAAIGAMLGEPTPEEQLEFRALCDGDPSVMDDFVRCSAMDEALHEYARAQARRKINRILTAAGTVAIAISAACAVLFLQKKETSPAFTRAGVCTSVAGVLRTDSQGICDMSIPESGVTLRLYANTSVRYQKTGGSLKAYVDEGTVLVQAEKRKPGESLEVETDQGTIQFLGTTVFIQSDPSRNRIEVVEGSVLFNHPEKCGTKSETVAAEGTELLAHACEIRSSAIAESRKLQLRAETKNLAALRNTAGLLDDSSRTNARLANGIRQRISLTDGTSLVGTALQENGTYYVIDELGKMNQIPEQNVMEIVPVEDP